MLKKIILSLDDVEEMYRPLYQEGKDGKFYLQVEGDEDITGLKNALASERENAKTARAELAKFKDLDPDKYKEAMKKLQDLEDKKLLDEGKVEELLNQRTERMRTEYNEQTSVMKEALDTKDKKISELNHRLGEEMNEKAIMAAIPSVGQVRPGAMTDIVRRARETWRLNEDGSHMAYGSDGKPRYGNDGKSPLSHKEWLEDLAKEAPFFFEGSHGGGGGMPPDAKGGKGLTPDQQNLPPASKLSIGFAQSMTDGK